MDEITIVLADDHAAMRQSLRTLLDGEADLHVIAETSSVSAVESQVHAHRPDVLVLDLRPTNGRPGLEALGNLHSALPHTPVVVLTMHDDPAFAQRALGHGATGVVLKDMADSDLPAAVRAACEGKRYVSPRIAATLDGAGRGERLTPREREVLRLIALGHTSVEIAEQLGLSPRTIETHRARIHRKLSLVTRAELVQYALRQGILKV